MSDKRESKDLQDGVGYITRGSVDLFFATEVSVMKVTPRHTSRFACALQSYANNVEHIGEGFVVKSTNVKESLKA